MHSLTITIIQTKLYWENKEANLAMLKEKIESIPNYTELVILPEMFSTGFSMDAENLAETMEGPTLTWMKGVAQKNRIILTGSIIIKEDGKFYNRLIWMLPNGQFGQYDKRHLFAFAGEDKYFTAGNKKLIASVKGWKINLQICYDLRFPVWGRQTKMPDETQDEAPSYDILLNVANWPERRSRAWKTLLCARAIENQCIVIGVNRVGNDGFGNAHSGNSLIVDALGEIFYHMADDEDIFTITLQKEELEKQRKSFPFLNDADSFTIFP